MFRKESKIKKKEDSRDLKWKWREEGGYTEYDYISFICTEFPCTCVDVLDITKKHTYTEIKFIHRNTFSDYNKEWQKWVKNLKSRLRDDVSWGTIRRWYKGSRLIQRTGWKGNGVSHVCFINMNRKTFGSP